MEKKLQDYAGYYIGCPCLNTWFPEDHNCYNAGWKLRGFHSTSIKPFRLENDTDFTWTDSVKLVLRRLEDMTEEEMIGMMQATVPDDMEKQDRPSNDEYIMNMFYADGGNLVDERVAVGAEVTLRCFEGQVSIWKCGTIYIHDDAGEEQFRVNDPKAFHYLLKQGFDLFGLFEYGLAIDAATLPK